MIATITRSPRISFTRTWLPVVVLFGLAAATSVIAPAWIFMWTLGAATFGLFKWFTLLHYVQRHQIQRHQAVTPLAAVRYLAAWPGMNAVAFFSGITSSPHRREWQYAIAKVAIGLALLFGLARYAITVHPLLAGWVGMIGIAFALHFGIFHLLSLFWRSRGVDAQPVMNAPILASSISDFWSCRWNLAFRDAAHLLVFRPLVSRVGGRAAALAVFLVSGLVHDVVISLTTGAGYGLPTLYFILQAAGFLLERRIASLRGGWRGRCFTALVVVAPLGLLFHTAFVYEIVLPMMRSLNCV